MDAIKEAVREVRDVVDEYVRGEKKVETVQSVQPIWDETKKMHCLVWNGKHAVEYIEHARPSITEPTDIILKVT
ncbi:hypothetical protein AAVH_39922, partial [Aphelenchoides avenae]